MKPARPPVLIAIVGGSGAGKTWLARRLEATLAPGVMRLSLDDFYRDRAYLAPARRERINYDHPRAIDWRRLEEVLRALRAGRPVPAPRHDFATHSRMTETRLAQPRPFVLVEGLWLLRRPALRRLFARKIYVECPVARRRARRIQRDERERGRSRASVVRQFREIAVPMHDRFVAPQARWADTILESPVSVPSLHRLLAELNVLLGLRSAAASRFP